MSLLRKCDRCSKTVPAENTPAWTTLRVELVTSTPVVEAELCPECTRDVKRFVSEPPQATKEAEGR